MSKPPVAWLLALLVRDILHTATGAEEASDGRSGSAKPVVRRNAGLRVGDWPMIESSRRGSPAHDADESIWAQGFRC